MTFKILNTIAHLTYKRRRTADRYVNLVNNGYIYRWALPALLRFKAIK